MSQLVSILLPVKNTAEFLPECLDSILSQTATNWELIAINDHSTDNSPNILRTYAQHDQRIKVFDNTGKGIIPALRLAYSKSQGTHITRMDSDDRMAGNKLKVLQNNLLKKGQEHIAIGQVKYFSAAGVGGGYQRYETWLNELTIKGNNYQERYKECAIPSPCWMVHRADLDRCGAFTPNRYPEDYDLFFRFYQHQLSIIPSNQVLHYWRDYPERTSRNDPNYADNRFLTLKMSWFLELDYQANRPLVLWGAGKKGKWIARFLVENQIRFHWICNNENKIGHTIYGCVLQDDKLLSSLENPHTIVAIANVEAQEGITFRLEQMGTLGEDFFFFC